MNPPRIIPGMEFICTRDLIIYPEGFFLDCGIYAALGYYVFPRKRGLYVDYSVVFPAFMPDSVIRGIPGILDQMPSRIAAFRKCSLVVSEFRHRMGLGGKPSAIGARLLDKAMSREPVWEEILVHVAKEKEGA